MSVKFSKDHEWVSVAGDIATIGITNHAQEQLGDVVFVELPAIGKKVTKGGDAAVVESVKAASEVYAPVTGEVVAVNKELEGDPALVNRGAEGDGWFMKVKITNPAELSELMDKAAYDKFVAKSLRSPVDVHAPALPNSNPVPISSAAISARVTTETAEMLREWAPSRSKTSSPKWCRKKSALRGRLICQRPGQNARHSPTCATWPTAMKCSPP